MADLNAKHKSHNKLTVTITDDAGALVTGATVTLTVKDAAGATVTGLDGVTMVEDSGDPGHYTYTMSNTVLDTEDVEYEVQVTAVAGASTRYAERSMLNAVG